MSGLTERHLAGLRVIQDHVRAHGIAPSYRQIAKAMGLKSPTVGMQVVDALVAKGYVKRIPGFKDKRKARGLVLVFGPEGEPNWQGIAILAIEENKVMRDRLTRAHLPCPPKSVDY